MKTKNNTFWLIVGFLGGLFAVVENGHELYENYKVKKAEGKYESQ